MRPHTITTNGLAKVARATAMRDGITVRFQGDRAYTNGKVITLPTLRDDDPESLTLVRGYLDHETAHCRFTDFPIDFGPVNSVLHHFCQIIEDARIERAHGATYLGCRANLERLVTQLVNCDDAPELFVPATPSDEPSDLLIMLVLQVLRSEHVGQSALVPACQRTREIAVERLGKELVQAIETHLAKVVDLSSTADTVEMANQLVEIISSFSPEDESAPPDDGDRPPDNENGSDNEPTETPDSLSGDSEDQGDGEGAGSPEASDSEARDDDQSNADDNDSSGDQPADNPKPQKSSGNDSDETGDETGSTGAKACDPMTPEERASIQDAVIEGSADLGTMLEEALEARTEHSDEALSCVFSPGGDAAAESSVVEPVDTAACHQDTLRLRLQLAALLQAEKSVRSGRSRQGIRLNRKRLPMISHPNAKVFAKRRKKQGLSTGVHVLLDRSSSMKPIMCRAGEACWALMKSLDAIEGVTRGCSAFPGVESNSTLSLTRQGQSLAGSLNNYVPRAIGGTPMASALCVAAEELLSQRADRYVLLVVTDGQPNDLDATLSHVARLRRANIECIGIGICTDPSDVFGRAHSITIADVSDLAPELFRVMRGLLTQAA